MSKLWTEEKIKEEPVSGSYIYGLVKTGDDEVAIAEIFPGIGFSKLDESLILSGDVKDEILTSIVSS